MIISLLHPSRSRPHKALETIKLWLSKASGTHKIEHILSLDYDDPEFENYKVMQHTDWTLILCSNNDSAVTATNKAAKISKGDILIMLSDDFECPQNWDSLIVQAYENRSGVLKTFDGLQKWLVTLAIMDRKYYEEQGYFYFDQYKHMFCDTEMSHKAELEGKLIVRNDLLFPHKHYSTNGNIQDETTKRANATWNSGEKIYLKRVKECFGLKGVDPLNISDKQTRDWLAKKLKQTV